ncbi:MAG: hypothetical protein R3D62_00325 [Xanthobacteraceae bacterium]
MFSLLTSSPDTAAGDRAALTRAVKDMVRRHFDLAGDESVFVAEVACGETDCPDVETVIVVFVAGEHREFKIRKPVAAIVAQDLREPDHSGDAACGNSHDSQERYVVRS